MNFIFRVLWLSFIVLLYFGITGRQDHERPMHTTTVKQKHAY